ncbi:predicted protein [Lichtheimia corymbifera JMRC:FSU:9682]|uniref:Uncharacterized protein n=1 Tax=Lichtheimia corymbifera JMRC:FSU:9682 TaxID=1263082 RepID=A0A068RT12_9FUNG|nr:predicted protein [Lichtheimia corymbifera JMRC:FSU:9682]
MKFSSLLVVFTGFLLTVVSAARYPAILKFQPSPRIFPPPYFTLIDLPTIGKTLRVNLWQNGSPQTLTEAYAGYISRGHVEVEDISAFDGRYAALVNDDTETLYLRIQGDDQLFAFIGQSATEQPVKDMKVRADVRPLQDDLYNWW